MEDFDCMEDDSAPLYNGDRIPAPRTKLTVEQQTAMLDWHPIFTGRCPECERPVTQTTPPRVHWDCEHCRWVDDSV